VSAVVLSLPAGAHPARANRINGWPVPNIRCSVGYTAIQRGGSLRPLIIGEQDARCQATDYRHSTQADARDSSKYVPF